MICKQYLLSFRLIVCIILSIEIPWKKVLFYWFFCTHIIWHFYPSNLVLVYRKNGGESFTRNEWRVYLNPRFTEQTSSTQPLTTPIRPSFSITDHTSLILPDFFHWHFQTRIISSHQNWEDFLFPFSSTT